MRTKVQRPLRWLPLLLGAYFSLQPVLAQIPVPGQPSPGKTLILNATAHLGNGQVIRNAAIAFENGKITAVTDAGLVPPDTSGYTRIIRAEGKHVYPGFIAGNTRLGLVEIGQVRATHDYDEAGEFLPNVRALVSYNTDSKITPTVRSNGVLVAEVAPKGGTISGVSSVMELDAWNWEDAVVRADAAIHLFWPKMFQQTGWWAEPGETKPNKIAEKKIAAITAFFTHAKAYAQVTDHAEQNLRYEAMREVFDGRKAVFVHANEARDILRVINFVRQFELPRVVLVGGYDAWRLADQLKDLKIAVMLRRVHALPLRHDDDIDLPFRLPALLHEAGLLFCLQNAGDMEAMNTRNLPFLAGTAVAHGLDPEVAVQAITLNAARILGVDDRLGSLEVGKDATLFISTGDALDPRSNNVEHAFIQGRVVDLDNHQRQLYRKFQAKYRQN
ncbi:MAG: amidohydrolase family protein [Bacteroidota bacterium]